MDSILIQNITPSSECALYPLKTVVGEPVIIEADVLRDGFRDLRAVLKVKKKGDPGEHELAMVPIENDRWRGQWTPGDMGLYSFAIEAWTEPLKGMAKEEVTRSVEHQVTVDRKQAVYGAWYEMFPRSEGNFKSVTTALPRIKQMGFDILYLTPIHPIGTTARKGKNGSLQATAQDPGSPWAIGNSHGGHTAIDPSLGTLDDFKEFVKTSSKLGLEVAMDFAIQCSPDHPWIKAHPEWFYWRPDGTLQCAENPPMKYEDIVPLNFETKDWKNLWEAWRQVLLFWINAGVKIFRVDNPHTKPFAFWEWLINSIKQPHPEVIFLAEAFTRPKIMKALSQVGFTQSYTYFIWRTTKPELEEYVAELTTLPVKSYFRPNFFVSTHDVLHDYLIHGGRSAFKIRCALAALLSPSWGIYSGTELCENQVLPGTTDYLDSEKFEIKKRNWNQEGNISGFIASLNRIRNENPSLQELSNVVFFPVKNENLLAFGKTTASHSNSVIVVVSLDSKNPQEGSLQVLQDKMGMAWGSRFEVRELLSNTVFCWSEHNQISVTPDDPVRIYRIERRNL